MSHVRMQHGATLDWTERARRLGPTLAENSARHDVEGTFVSEAFDALRSEGYLAALVPEALGGLGADVDEICAFVRELARHCPSTALAYSMHTHLVAATVWRHLHGKPGEALLRRVAMEKLVLVSTGAGDWLESNGRLVRVDGGYRFTAAKPFGSGGPAGDLLITSGRFDDPERGPLVLHFPLSLHAEGVRVADDWNTHGMRGTGSHTVHIESAFVAEDTVALTRPQGAWDPAFDVICTLAFPIIMAVYAGVAGRAAELALERARARRDDPDVQSLAGQLCNARFQVDVLFDAIVANAANFDFSPTPERSTRSAQAKTLLAEACIRTVEKAMEVAGGSGYFRKNGIEALLRDVRAATYHPLQPMAQLRFSGRVALGLDLSAVRQSGPVSTSGAQK